MSCCKSDKKSARFRLRKRADFLLPPRAGYCAAPPAQAPETGARAAARLRARRCAFPSRPWSTMCRTYSRSAKTRPRADSQDARETAHCFSSGVRRPPHPGMRCRRRASARAARAKAPRARHTAACRSPAGADPRAGRCSPRQPMRKPRAHRTRRRRRSRRFLRRARRPDTDSAGAWCACVRRILRHPARCTQT